MKSEELRLHGLRKAFGPVEAVAGIDLEVSPGRIMTLLGPSGCGKTTLLRMIAGFAAPTAGKIVLGDVNITDVAAARRNIGVVFQNYALFPHLTVFENVAFGLRVRRLPKAEVMDRVWRMLSLVKLTEHSERYPSQLSGGQQQRAALARALAIDPGLLLLDEPLSALDKNLRQSVQTELRQLQRQLGITTIVVTHDQEEAFVLSDQVAVMSEGRILQFGTPQDLYNKPSNRFVAEFLGSGNFISARIVASDGSEFAVETRCGVKLSVRSSFENGSSATSLFIRPEDFYFEAASKNDADIVSFEGALVGLRKIGGRTETEIELDDGTRLVSHRLRREIAPAVTEPGARVKLCVNRDAIVLVAG